MDWKRHYQNLVLHTLVPSTLVLPQVRRHLLKKVGVCMEDHCDILPGCYFEHADVQLGKNVLINFNFQYCSSGVEKHSLIIGNNVSIGPGCTVITATHEIGGAEKRAGKSKTLSVSIGSGTWIGANVTILPGVQIAPGCVIGAGACVTSNTEKNGVYAGVPATLIRQLDANVQVGE